jgi:translation initiation factor IF-3
LSHRKVRWCTISKQRLKVNGGIKAERVRLIDESNNQVGIVDRHEALNRARDVGLDLVEVAPTSEPPVCRIMDFGKWQYQQKRKVREAHKKEHRHAGTLKEIRLRPETDKHDLDIKLDHAREFLEKGHKVQFTMFFRGRQMLHRDKGYDILQHITELLEELAKVERPARATGRRMTLLLVPKS